MSRDERREISHDCPTDEKLPLACLFYFECKVLTDRECFYHLHWKEALMNAVKAFIDVPQIKINTCVPFCFEWHFLTNRESESLIRY